MSTLRAFAIGIPLLVVGIFLCASVWLSPIGIIFVFASGVPLAKVEMAKVQAQFREEHS